MIKLYRFDEFKRPSVSNKTNENSSSKLSTKDAKETIKDIFKKFDGEVSDKYLKNVWEEDSTLRELYGKKTFDKAWDELIDEKKVKTEDGKKWCWCDMVEESFLNENISKEDEEKYLSPKQRKLPEGLKKAIISRAKKAKKTKKDTDKK